MIKAIIFDFDGLIFDTETCELKSFEELYAKYGVTFPKEEWLKIIGTISTYDPYASLMAAVPHLNMNDLMAERESFFEKIVEGESVREGVKEYIERGKELGLKVAIASSSSRRWIEKYLGVIGLDISLFDVICTSDDVKNVKPDPELYEKVLSHFGIKPDEAIVFEDSANGSLAAIRANIPCVIVPNEVTKGLIFDERVVLRLNSKKDMELDRVIEFISSLK
ncbi:HAD family hydrolase [Pradoshia sp.]|uniref:HAD family hydrolase n=1 Tax=Pradoshia sp. TaxID=2651281 RepID=UPI003F0F0179